MPLFSSFSGAEYIRILVGSIVDVVLSISICAEPEGKPA